ncbi:MAG: GNAT family N-acetyltransferase [Pseudomonadales bacterium]
MKVHVLEVDWPGHEDTLRAIRTEVFVEEQGVPRELEWDGEDDLCHHFLAITEAGQRVGCGRLMPSGQIGRMAVLKRERGKGIGAQILEAAVEAGKALGFRRLFLHAQKEAVPFYRKAGFLPEGGEFMEAGIPHQGMAMELPIPFEPPEDVPKPDIREEAAPETAEQAELKQFVGEGDCVQGLLETLGWPLRTVRLYSQELDHLLFDRPDVTDALSAFVRRGPPTRLQVLIHSSSSIVSRGHQLLELARRLDSKIEIRKVPAELAVDRHSCVITDERGYFLLPDYEEYQALANAYDPVQAARLAERFDYLWEHAHPDPELRVLRI